MKNNNNINCHCESNEVIQKSWNNIVNGLLHKNSQWQYSNKKSELDTPKAFTLVELIVVITILAILWTIAFISFQWYTQDARDGVRISDMNNINKWLALSQLKSWIYPKPDNSVTISASWTIIWYEWTVWENVSRIINTNKIITDPLDDTPYIYYTNATNTTYQLLWYLEWNSLTLNNLINTTYAATDYTKRYPKVLWNNLWILLDTSNNPITTDIDLFGTQSWTLYKSYISNETIKTLSWVELWWPLITLSKSLNFQWPTTCPEWFIKVPWNEEFMQPGFCVAKYEASYSTPNNITTLQDRETDDYIASKTDIVSKAWWYAITEITQTNAIASCKSLWEWYHLITNNEWMTIARNIEATQSNWSGNAVWSWFIYNGRSEDLSRWCDWNWDSSRAEPTWIECSEKRNDLKSRNILLLSNWEEIWDLAWNVREHVNKANTIDWTNYNFWWTKIIWSSGWTSWDDDGKYDINDMKKYWSNLWLWTLNGMWTIYYATWRLNNIFLRWADAGSTIYAGCFSLYLHRISTSQNRGAGFRCAK